MAKKLLNLDTREYEWVLSEQEYDSWQQAEADSDFLQNLRSAGVDNWDGYHYGWTGFDEDE